MRTRSRRRLAGLPAAAMLFTAVLFAAGCADARRTSQPAGANTGARYSKVLLIVEENEPADRIIGNPDAFYINQLAETYGTATNMNAGYPTRCPSLAAYLIMTSGSTHGICDDDDPRVHRITGDNLFQQVAAAGKEWRGYAESMPANCTATNTKDDVYLVRHAPAPYYVSEAGRCRQWDVPLGSFTAGALHDDVTAGTLPAFSFVTPDACHDMHGAPSCEKDLIIAGDAWLAQWMPKILTSPDYTSGKLVIILTWDEGSETDNHIPTLVISPTTRRISAPDAFTHCSTLRTIEEILDLPLLGCAAQAQSMRPALKLG